MVGEVLGTVVVLIGVVPVALRRTVVVVRFAAIDARPNAAFAFGSVWESLGAVQAANTANTATVATVKEVRPIDQFMNASRSPSSVGPPSGREGPAARCLCIGAPFSGLEPGSHRAAWESIRSGPVASRP